MVALLVLLGYVGISKRFSRNVKKIVIGTLFFHATGNERLWGQSKHDACGREKAPGPNARYDVTRSDGGWRAGSFHLNTSLNCATCKAGHFGYMTPEKRKRLHSEDGAVQKAPPGFQWMCRTSLSFSPNRVLCLSKRLSRVLMYIS